VHAGHRPLGHFVQGHCTLAGLQPGCHGFFEDDLPVGRHPEMRMPLGTQVTRKESFTPHSNGHNVVHLPILIEKNKAGHAHVLHIALLTLQVRCPPFLPSTSVPHQVLHGYASCPTVWRCAFTKEQSHGTCHHKNRLFSKEIANCGG
jgi:hypothetical protein